MAKKYNKRYKSSKQYKSNNLGKSYKSNNDGYDGNKHAYRDDKLNWKNQRRTSNFYVDKNGEYKEKPWFANFFKVGFSDDIPTRADYNREVDGVKYTGALVGSGHGASDAAKRHYKAAQLDEEQDYLMGLERFQLSLIRLWNGSPREWLKLLTRIVILLVYFGAIALLVKSCVG